jgi:uncharacterized protein YqjF (DUF2071 family)
MPATPWKWRQTWHDLLFAHWPIPAVAVRALVPGWLDIHEYGGTTWVGLVPFRMTGVTLRRLPSLPVISHFPEMNLRLYVERDGKPGIWFISLDAARRSAVYTARVFAHLPYFFSRMSLTAEGDAIGYSSVRAGGAVAFKGSYAPTGPVRETSQARSNTSSRNAIACTRRTRAVAGFVLKSITIRGRCNRPKRSSRPIASPNRRASRFQTRRVASLQPQDRC